MGRKTMYPLAAVGLLLCTPAFAEDPATTAHEAMHEAMHEQMAMPEHQPMMPDRSMAGPVNAAAPTQDGDHAARHHQAQREAQQAGAHAQDSVHHQQQAEHHAEQHAMHRGMHAADANRADAANRAAMGAMGAGMGSGMGDGMMGGCDAQRAAEQQHTSDMHPGGMMSGGGTTPGGMH